VSVEIEIRGHGGGIGIVVLGYENPAAANGGSDANWLLCKVRVGIGPFRGEVTATFATQHFARFRQELQALLGWERASAAFETDEQVLEVKIEAKPTGAARISGIVRWSSGPSVAVSFTLDSDQSYLGPILEALGAVTTQFPVRG
jgi:hypothetical protein